MIGSRKYSNKVASALIKTGPGILHGVVLAAGSDAATLILYDNTAGSGTIICNLAAITGTSASVVLDVAFGTGLYMALTGTSPSGLLPIKHTEV